MNDIFISVLLTSGAAALVGILLLLFKPLYKSKLTKAWQYYIWLIVLARLLIPYSPAIKMPEAPQPARELDAPVTSDMQTGYINAYEAAENENITQADAAGFVTFGAYSNGTNETPKAAKTPKQEYTPGKFNLDFAYKYLWVIWISAAASLFALKAVSYLRYTNRVKKSASGVADEHILSAYAEICGFLKLKRAPKIYEGDVSSPMLIGVIRPVIVLPYDYEWAPESTKLILTHELTHFLRKDIWVKWLTQIAVCMHFFNPLVHIFTKEISKNCELSCDDAVLDTMEAPETRSYGDALIAVAGIASDKKGASAAAMMSSEGKFLKKRLEAIMLKSKNTKKHTVISLFTAIVVLALAVLSGCALSGVKPQDGAAADTPARAGGGLGKIVGIYSDARSYGAIDEDGKVYVWGGNATVPQNLPPVQKIGFCDYGVIALGEDGKLYGWRTALPVGMDADECGAMDFLDDTYKDMTFIDIAAGGYNTTAVSSDGKVYAWGEQNDGGQKNVPADLPPIVSIYRSAYATTALDAEGNIYRWGVTNNRLELNDITARMVAPLAYEVVILGKDGKIYGEVPHIDTSAISKEQPHIENIKAIFGGMSNVAAIDEDGKVYIWGEHNDYGFSQITQQQNRAAMFDVPLNLPPMVEIAFGFNSVMGLGDDGMLYIWGPGSSAGLPENTQAYITPARPPENIDGFKNGGPEYAPKEAVNNNSDPSKVSDTDEFARALQNSLPDIYIDGVIDVKLDVNINENQTLHIMPGGVLNIHTSNFNVRGDIINDGVINVYGRLRVCDTEITQFGSINAFSGEAAPSMFGGAIAFDVTGDISVSEMKAILNGDLPYTGVNVMAFDSKITLVIDEDYTLPANKFIWLNSAATLKIAAGSTFTADGKVETYFKPIIEGTVIGEENIELCPLQ